MKRKEKMKYIILTTVFVAVMCGAFYIGISRELCRRDYPAQDYEAMKLDCNSWLYR